MSMHVHLTTAKKDSSGCGVTYIMNPVCATYIGCRLAGR